MSERTATIYARGQRPRVTPTITTDENNPRQMNIPGLDYNTRREKLVLPAYGRDIQSMVDYAVALTDKADRQHCAENIIGVMELMVPQNKETPDYKRRLWDHLAIMSGFKLDIDYPYDVSQARSIQEKPQPLSYPTTHIPVRHYGRLIAETLEKLKTMPAGTERDELTRNVANQMRRDLRQWGHSSNDDERVAADISSGTGGAVTINLATFKFDNTPVKEPVEEKKKRKRR